MRDVLRFVGIYLLSSLAFALSASAEEWTKSYSISGKPDLRVDTSDADIRVSTWEQNTVATKITTTGYKIGDGGIRIEERQSGDKVEIDVHYPHPHINFGGRSHHVEIEIQMPREGRMDLRTGDGKIGVADFKGEMQLRSGDGSEEIERVEGKLHATTGDGHIHASGRFDELELKSGDGHVDAKAAEGSTLGSSWKIESGDGNVALEIPPSLSADVDLHTGDGHIDLDMPVVTSGQLRPNEVHGKLNNGGNLLKIHTGDGSIRLRKG